MTSEGTRHAARERALELLYEAEQKGLSVESLLSELPVEPDQHTLDLVVGVAEHQAEIDDLIRRFARNWALERMPMLDRAILRLATFELAHRADVPTAVVIDEAVELAKAFSTDDSGRFVNGVLSAVAREVR